METWSLKWQHGKAKRKTYRQLGVMRPLGTVAWGTRVAEGEVSLPGQIDIGGEILGEFCRPKMHSQGQGGRRRGYKHEPRLLTCAWSPMLSGVVGFVGNIVANVEALVPSSGSPGEGTAVLCRRIGNGAGMVLAGRLHWWRFPEGRRGWRWQGRVAKKDGENDRPCFVPCEGQRWKLLCRMVTALGW